ncbi:MAG: hypothetical protein PHP23_05710 [Desulfobacterales bacterium]|nr:hypothetical protein [Desulfobacterales bacterium]MDD4071412.1 hypothetical protein [Desulfobacterales bacterium]MDD4391457.1 hypothetical protein [Desulfobacterales bacterium]
MNDEVLKKQAWNIFWLYEYSKRHFHRKSKYFKTYEWVPAHDKQYLIKCSWPKADKDMFRRRLSLVEILEWYLRFIEQWSSQSYLQIIRNSLVPNGFLVDLAAGIIVYHNENNPRPEDSFRDFRISDETLINCRNVLNKATQPEKNVIKILHEITYDYGYYAWDLLIAEPNSDKLLNLCLSMGDKIDFPAVESFLKKAPMNRNNAIITEYLYENKFAEYNNRSKHNLLVYIDPRDKSVSFNNIKNNVLSGIAVAQNGKVVSVGNPNTAKILFRINVKSKSFTKNFVLQTIECTIEADHIYQNKITFISSISDEMLQSEKNKDFLLEMIKQNAQTKKMIACYNKIISPPSEQRDPISRAIGLWLWDRVHFTPKPITQTEAIKEILKRKLPAQYDMSENKDRANKDYIERVLRKEYQLACQCIEKRELLSLSEVTHK